MNFCNKLNKVRKLKYKNQKIKMKLKKSNKVDKWF